MHLLRYVLRIDTKKQIILMIMVLTSVILSVVNINFIRIIINQAVMFKRQDLLLIYIGIYFLILLVSNGLSYLSNVLFMEVSQKTLTKLRIELYNHILKLDIGFYHRTSVGEIMSRIISEVQELGSFLSTMILIPLMSITSIIGGLILITAIDWKVGIISFVIFSGVFKFLPALNESLEKLVEEWSKKIRNISEQTEESISHYMEIQSNNTFFYEEYKFRNSLKEFSLIGVELGKVFAKSTFISDFFSGLATLSALGVGGWIFIDYLKHGNNPNRIGDLTAMITAIGTIINPIQSLISYFQNYKEALVKFDMLSDYLDIPQEMVDKENAQQVRKVNGKIKMENISFGFEPSKKILKNINLDIKEGTRIAFVGPAGCGKSTLSILINRMMKTNTGEVKIDDINILDMKLDSLRKNIGYVAQSKTNTPVLFSGNLVDNIIYSLKTKKDAPSKESQEWLDMESIGIDSLEKLKEEIILVIKNVDFYEDVFNFGLRSVTLLDALKEKENIFKIRDPESFRSEILKGRKKLQEKMKGEYEGLVEFFHEDKFMNYCNIMENIIFTSPDSFLKDHRMYESLKKVLITVCEETCVHDKIFEIGCKIAVELGDIFKHVKSEDSQLIRKLGIPQTDFKQFASIGEKFNSQGAQAIKKEFPPSLLEQLLRLGYEYNITQGLDFYIDEDFKEKILKTRKLFKKKLTPELKDKITFYDKDKYIDGSTIMENLIMGKMNTIVQGAEDRVSNLLKEVISEVRLEDEIISLGLLTDIGERGAKLSGGQSQKTAIARVLLKKPEILILDEATSALDNASQQKINETLLKCFKDKTVITIAHRLDTIKDYDKIVVLKAGEIMEVGSFNELMKKKGLFFEHWETLFGERR